MTDMADEEKTQEQPITDPPKVKSEGGAVTLWLIRSLFALILSGAIPLSSWAVSCGAKTAEMREQRKNKQAKIELKQRQLQLDLLKQIIDVAKRADFKDPTSLYRLGLIAHMVNENQRVFGIELITAEKNMQRMFEQLAPITTTRKQLDEISYLLAVLKERSNTAKKNEKILTNRIIRLKEDYKVVPAWRRQAVSKDVDEKELELEKHRIAYQFYATWLFRMGKIKESLEHRLNLQAKELEATLRDTAMLRQRLSARTEELRFLAQQLEGESTEAKVHADTLRTLVKQIDEDSQSAVQMIKRLRAEVDGEAEEKAVVYEQLTRCKVAYDYCQRQMLGETKCDAPASKSAGTPPAKAAPKATTKRPTSTERAPIKQQIMQGIFSD